MNARRFLIAIGLCSALATGCGDDGDGDGGSAQSTTEVTGGDSESESGEGAADLDFCEAVAALETSFQEDEPALAAALEAETPAGLEEAVAVVREYTDRRQAGEDVFQDPDFLEEYDDATLELRDHCGT